MKQTITRSTFIQAFVQQRPENFTREALHMLYDYFEQYELETGEEVELDVIAICCDYSEMCASEVIREYNISDAFEGEFIEQGNDTSRKLGAIDYLRDYTIYLGETSDGRLVFQNF
jgi:hypothetical protein